MFVCGVFCHSRSNHRLRIVRRVDATYPMFMHETGHKAGVGILLKSARSTTAPTYTK